MQKPRNLKRKKKDSADLLKELKEGLIDWIPETVLDSIDHSLPCGMGEASGIRVQIGRIGSLEEWAMVELQGVFVFKEGTPHVPVDEGSWAAPSVVDLGQMTVSGSHALLAVGNSRLEGSVVDLHTPMLVCERVEDGTQSGIVQHRVVGFLKKKIIFSTRPKTV